MPGLDHAAVAEGLHHLPGWERRGNQIVKTFLLKDLAHTIPSVTRRGFTEAGRRSRPRSRRDCGFRRRRPAGRS
jgi:hypothetical protein